MNHWNNNWQQKRSDFFVHCINQYLILRHTNVLSHCFTYNDYWAVTSPSTWYKFNVHLVTYSRYKFFLFPFLFFLCFIEPKNLALSTDISSHITTTSTTLMMIVHFLQEKTYVKLFVFFPLHNSFLLRRSIYLLIYLDRELTVSLLAHTVEDSMIKANVQTRTIL